MPGYLHLAAVVAILTCSFAAHAQDRWEIQQRQALPLNGQSIDLALLSSDDEIRFTLSGVVWSRLDGSRIDAQTHELRDTRSVGSFVRVPPHARLIEADPVAHRYVYAVPRHSDLQVSFNPALLANRNLVTYSEAVASLRGVIELEVLTKPRSAAEALAVPTAASSEFANRPTVYYAMGGATALGLPMLGLAAWMRRRRNRREEELLIRRARTAARACEREAARLGPAFDEVGQATQRTLEAVLAVRAHIASTEQALHRTKTAISDAARERRRELIEKRDQSQMRLRILTERLEETSVLLASREADHTDIADITDVTEALRTELDLAIDADREARG